MNRRSLIFLGVFLGLTVAAYGSLLAAAHRRNAVVSYTFVENFEDATTGYDSSNAHSWTTYGAANPKYTTAPLQGAQSLYSPTGGLAGAYATTGLTGQMWIYFQMYCVTGVVDDWQVYGDVAETSVRIGFSGGKMQLYIGGTSNIAASTFPLDQKVHVWLRYNPGTGTASGDVWYSTTGTKPGSPQCTVSGATTTTELSRLWLVSRSTYAIKWDRVIINTSAIGSNP